MGVWRAGLAKVTDGSAELLGTIEGHLAAVELGLELMDQLFDIAFAVLPFGHFRPILLHLTAQQLDFLTPRCLGACAI